MADVSSSSPLKSMEMEEPEVLCAMSGSGRNSTADIARKNKKKYVTFLIMNSFPNFFSILHNLKSAAGWVSYRQCE